MPKLEIESPLAVYGIIDNLIRSCDMSHPMLNCLEGATAYVAHKLYTSQTGNSLE